MRVSIGVLSLVLMVIGCKSIPNDASRLQEAGQQSHFLKSLPYKDGDQVLKGSNPPFAIPTVSGKLEKKFRVRKGMGLYVVNQNDLIIKFSQKADGSIEAEGKVLGLQTHAEELVLIGRLIADRNMHSDKQSQIYFKKYFDADIVQTGGKYSGQLMLPAIGGEETKKISGAALFAYVLEPSSFVAGACLSKDVCEYTNDVYGKVLITSKLKYFEKETFEKKETAPANSNNSSSPSSSKNNYFLIKNNAGGSYLDTYNSLVQKAKNNGQKFMFVHLSRSGCPPCAQLKAILLTDFSKKNSQKVLFAMIDIWDQGSQPVMNKHFQGTPSTVPQIFMVNLETNTVSRQNISYPISEFGIQSIVDGAN